MLQTMEFTSSSSQGNPLNFEFLTINQQNHHQLEPPHSGKYLSESSEQSSNTSTRSSSPSTISEAEFSWLINHDGAEFNQNIEHSNDHEHGHEHAEDVKVRGPKPESSRVHHRKHETPEEKYLRRRMQNNISVKKCRLRSKHKAKEREEEFLKLICGRREAKAKLEALSDQIISMKYKLNNVLVQLEQWNDSIADIVNGPPFTITNIPKKYNNNNN